LTQILASLVSNTLMNTSNKEIPTFSNA